MEDNKEAEEKAENIEVSLIKSIGNSEAKNIAEDLGEVALDTFLEDGVLKDIPVIGTLTKLYLVGATISGKIFEKKVIKFLTSLDKISFEKKQDFVNEIMKDAKAANKIGEHLLVILDRMDNLQKPIVLAKIFAAYIDKKIEYEMFLRLSSVIDKAFLPDIEKLSRYKQLQPGSLVTTSLENLGLVDLVLMSGGTIDEHGNESGNQYGTSGLGDILLSVLENY